MSYCKARGWKQNTRYAWSLNGCLWIIGAPKCGATIHRMEAEAEQRRSLLNIPKGSGRWDSRGLSVTRQWGGATVTWRSDGSMGTYRIFPFAVILGTVPGCNWSAGAYGYFKAGRLMSLFVFSSVISVGTFAFIKLPLLKPVA